VETADKKAPGFLDGVRVVELVDELGEYCGKVLAGLGADVIKVESPQGEETRSYGPFYQDQSHPDRSLHFWHYNYGKRGVVLDLESDEGRAQFRRLVDTADVLIDSRSRSYLADRGLGYDTLRKSNPGLVYTRMTAFGDDGPWADFKGSDLIHLALGGVMMNCGYDADPTGAYDTPPIAPQMWQAYHIAGEVTAIQIIAALNYRNESGCGQQLACSVHDAVAKNTETDMPHWVYLRQLHRRQTCAHSFPQGTGGQGGTGPVQVTISRTKDGRWIYPYRTYLPSMGMPPRAAYNVLKKYGCEYDVGDDKYLDPAYARRPEVGIYLNAVMDRFISKFSFDKDLWKDGQREGMAWAPLRRPEENVGEAHWAARETFAEVEYPELGRKFTQIHGKWVSPQVPWSASRRAPLLGEHTAEVLASLDATPTAASRLPKPNPKFAPVLSKHGKPFALSGVRVVDLSWLLASGGAGRFFTALGAEVIKVEHRNKIDAMRMGIGIIGEGGRAARDAATGPLPPGPVSSLNRSGAFMEYNAGKRALSLNLKEPRGKELLIELIKDADIIIEGFSPGTMDRMGLGYEKLREINPRIVYVQQSGLGQIGTYGQLRSYGPTAQAFSGLSEMSGFPEPYAPAGIGYSYLDWFGAYQMALAMMAGLYRQRQTGQGCWIDSSQVECGLYLTGTSVLDHSANGRRWIRYGNASPYKPAAPHGAYRTRGEDRWIAIAAFNAEQWKRIVEVLDMPRWLSDPKLASFEARLANLEYLDQQMNAATVGRDGYALMVALQAAGVPAGVCQTAQDRCETDPQLKHLGWQVELEQAEIGRWPVKEVPVSFSETPPYIGGVLDRHGPSYAQDNEYVLKELLGLSDEQVAKLAEQGVL
jgi:crotonobetainyl-CoA:carnitine CoA-transferase CaiB-like acyl-CoA transferase